MSQQYKATWGDSYVKPGTRVVGLEFFKDRELGYDKEDLEMVEFCDVLPRIVVWKLDLG